jgi:hypothetical protein
MISHVELSYCCTTKTKNEREKVSIKEKGMNTMSYPYMAGYSSSKKPVHQIIMGANKCLL